MKRAALLIACSALSLGCSEEGEPSEIVLRIASELDGSELAFVRVETLSAFGEQVADYRWLSVSPACSPSEPGMRVLGSMSVVRGDLPVARLRVTGLRANADGTATPIVEQRVDAVFRRGPMTVDVALTRACRDAAPCVDPFSCDAQTGACRDIRRVEREPEPPLLPTASCLSAMEQGPEVPSSASVNDRLCIPGDGRCPDGCDWQRDADCRIAVGGSCSSTGNPCVAGASCVHGFCCDQPCNGSCERCDLPGQPGRCGRVPYGSTPAPSNSPDARLSCSDDHVEVRCTAGQCESTCLPGYADCDGNLSERGCEEKLGTEYHCLGCKDPCYYGFCAPESGCTSSVSGSIATSSATKLSPGGLYATLLVRSSRDTTLRALGALVEPVYPGNRLRLAVYRADHTGLPDELVAQTDDLSVIDNTRSKIEAGPNVLRVEAPVLATELALDKTYLITIQVSDSTHLYGESGRESAFHTTMHRYSSFPPYFIAPVQTTSMLHLSLYAITTPG